MQPSAGYELVVLYDGKCAVCTGTAEWIRARDDAGRIETCDLQDPEVAARFPEFNAEAVRAQLHGVDQGGTVYIGVDALQQIGARLPVWHWVSWILGVPGIHWVAVRGYLVFARNRYAFNNVLDQHECGDACAIDWEKLAREAEAKAASDT